jgi:hypothetical protein
MDKVPKKRCPHGTRKNKAGECIPYVKGQAANDKPPTKRCPHGTRKNKAGECVPYVKGEKKVRAKKPSTTQSKSIPEEPRDPSLRSVQSSSSPDKKQATPSVSPNTPRTLYAKAQFKDKPIHLLDRATPISPSEPNILFQLSFSGPEQFKQYVNLSDNPQVDCFFQTMFSLGLRNTRLAKKNSVEVNTTKEVTGVLYEEMRKYLASSFGIPHELVEHLAMTTSLQNERGLPDNKVAIAYIKNFFNKYLKNNYCTIFGVDFARWNGSHVMVVYKHKNTVFFFDPQVKGIHDDKKVISKTLAHLAKYTRKVISALRFFTVKDLDEPVQILDTSCPVQYAY